jgi:hypothetical protein
VVGYSAGLGAEINRMRKIKYTFMGDTDVMETTVPDNWPDDAIAEVLAFRAGAKPGDIFELIEQPDGTYDVLATGIGI